MVLIFDDCRTLSWMNLERLFLENDLSFNEISRLESIIVDVISEELSAEAILNYLNKLGFHGINVELQLKSFFKIASYENIIIFINSIYNKFFDVDEYLYKIIVESILPYKGEEIDSLLSEIIMSSLCSDEVKQMIFDC